MPWTRSMVHIDGRSFCYPITPDEYLLRKGQPIMKWQVLSTTRGRLWKLVFSTIAASETAVTGES